MYVPSFFTIRAFVAVDCDHIQSISVKKHQKMKIPAREWSCHFEFFAQRNSCLHQTNIVTER